MTAHEAGECERQLAQLRTIIEMGDAGVLYADAAGTVLHANHRLCELVGIDDTWLDGLTLDAFERHLGQMLAADDPRRQPVSDLLDDLLAADGPAGGSQTTVIRLVSPRHVALRMSLTLTPARELLLFFRDVTRETEVDRMKSEFLSTAAHELRTPLASIFGFTELLLARQMPPVQQREILATVHRQADLLIKLINELLDLSRIEARQGKDFHRTLCSLNAIVRQTLRGLLVKDDSRQVRLQLTHGAESVMVDPDKTQQALLNVLSNAYKYSPGGGDIVLETVLKTQGGESFVGLRVTDQGIGMTTEQLARVFERFWRADPSGSIPGTGLGMSLVKEITELQDGHVQVESMPARGTAVTLWFPRTADFVLTRPSGLQELLPPRLR